MDSDQNSLDVLRTALQGSPDNVVLRTHIGDLLLRRGLGQEALDLFREGLARTPASEALKLGTARCYADLDKPTEALVILEDLLKRPRCAAEAHLLHAKLMLRRGDLVMGASSYRNAVEADESVADEDLAEALGVAEENAESEYDQEEVDEQGRIRITAELGDRPLEIEMERPDLRFEDIGGMTELKEEIRWKIIEPLAHPELYESYGKAAGGGILMYGPPGCGKTYLARATAGQVQSNFITIGIHDVLDMYVGNSERRLHEVFQYARQHSPCVLFFDEVDALGAKRQDMRASASRQVINQFLSELDGVKGGNEGLLVLAATNAPWHMDSAFRRPGRFDRVLFVPPPDEEARAEILRLHLRGKPQDSIDVHAVAKKAKGFSGADLGAVIDMAAEGKLREALKAGAALPLVTKDLQKALKKLRPTTKEWFNTARNYALYSNEGGLYDEVLNYLEKK